LSAHWARGLYEVDYEKIERMAIAGKITKDENKRLKKLLEKMEFINLRKSLMYNIILKIIEKQGKYLKSGEKAALEPLLQIEVARDLKVHPSIISRATGGLSIETPWGEEKPLKTFFLSSGTRQQETASRYIEEIIKEEKKPLSDKAIAVLLKDKYSITISPRTVAKYRNKMRLSSSFQR
jgi:RNA polymerase sigma-54 factor